MLAASRAKKKRKCVHSKHLSGNERSVAYSNEMRCFVMHGDRGAAQKKREKKYISFKLSLGFIYNKHEGVGPRYELLLTYVRRLRLNV